MQRKASGCGNAKSINYCPTDYTKWKRWGWYRGWDTFCFQKKKPAGAFQITYGQSEFASNENCSFTPKMFRFDGKILMKRFLKHGIMSHKPDHN